MKQMSPLINDCIDELMKKLPNYSDSQEEFNIYALYKRMTMDVICRCAFGVDTDMQNNPDNIYLQKCAQILATNSRQRALVKLDALFPVFGSLFGDILLFQNNVRRKLNHLFPSSTSKFGELPGLWLMNQVHKVIEMRSDEAKQRVDLLQLMLEAASHDNIEDSLGDEQSVPKKLTHDEIIANVVLFMVAGYETTSTSLAYSTYILANHPDIQRKLQEEIDQNYRDDVDTQNPDYNFVNNMHYMDLFIREVLRMYPIAASVINRQCMTETDVCGYKIAKDAVVQVDVYALHYDPELWGPEDPNEFCPERHSVKRHPMAYMPFGGGPRNCVGIRFALVEMKILLIRLLKHYTIVKDDQLEKNFNITEIAVIAPEEVWVRIEKRKQS
ncbi:unnamed protein product [Didymodactylos carnosus]|uniref:Cytochrome P450 n=1 Tax=Didymodactylos carnosus TaxID=1234261 RepID=A0A815WU34_9BILA|nr:unnamed protein product [Didymodactylos carnosus]CAF4408316.1 unnamed protein product [Didymodactylos carnosus]